MKAKIFGLTSAGLYGIDPITGKCDAEQLWKWLRIEDSVDPGLERFGFWQAALPSWKKKELIKRVDAQFSGGGSLDDKPGEAQ